MADSRLNALTTEVAMNTTPDARLNGVMVEALYTAPEIMISGVYEEMLYVGTPAVQVGATYTEVLMSTANTSSFVGWGIPT